MNGNHIADLVSTCPLDPKDEPQVRRILLSESASRHLDATSEEVFVVVSRVMRGTEEPATMGRWALRLVPCTTSQAADALRVAQGLKPLARIKSKPSLKP